ncbi:hypothetical protein FACS189459_2980 [Bacilli bacterium]|nr:hypothetical protein FACS189459_2980 [Bacilli bacterium]GHU51699.1 hypothetical protein FACS189496_0450 [Bacilli bacterium]
MSLNEVYRQTDIDFINALHAIRYGDTKNKFVLRLINKIDYSNRPNEINKDFTFFVPTNAEADEINNAKFDLINEQPISFKATLKGENQQHIDKLRKRCIAKENLELKISEKVICIANDPGHQYVNGNIGTIIQMNDRIVTVRLLNNKIIYIRPFK